MGPIEEVLPYKSLEKIKAEDVNIKKFYDKSISKEIVADAVNKLIDLKSEILDNSKKQAIVAAVKTGNVEALQIQLGMKKDQPSLRQRADGLFGKETMKNLEWGGIAYITDNKAKSDYISDFNPFVPIKIKQTRSQNTQEENESKKETVTENSVAKNSPLYLYVRAKVYNNIVSKDMDMPRSNWDNIKSLSREELNKLATVNSGRAVLGPYDQADLQNRISNTISGKIFMKTGKYKNLSEYISKTTDRELTGKETKYLTWLKNELVKKFGLLKTNTENVYTSKSLSGSYTFDTLGNLVRERTIHGDNHKMAYNQVSKERTNIV